MDEPARSRRPLRRLFRFSLLAALVAMSCIAGYLGGYRLGAERRARDDYNASVFVKTYYVEAIIVPTDGGSAEYGPLIEIVTSTLPNEDWRRGGVGGCEIKPFRANDSIVVSCSGSGHEELSDLLQTLRDLRYKLPNDLASRVREAAARKLTQSIPVKVHAPLGPADRLRMQEHFESAVRQLAAELGRPALVASARDVKFPEWATAQRIAVWDRRGGKLYFALQDCRPQGEALVAGWWEESFGPLSPLQIAPESMARHSAD